MTSVRTAGHSPGRDTSPISLPRARAGVISWKLLACAAAIPLTVLLALSTGSVSIPLPDLVTVLGAQLRGDTVDPALRGVSTIVVNTRLPRVMAALAAGAVLAVCGAVLQAMVRNPLADPYVLGISAGASTGAAAAITLGIGAALAAAAVPAAAFIGAIVASIIVLLMSGNSAQSSALRLIVVGLAVSYFFAALTNIIIFVSASPEATRSVMFWMLGSLATATWTKVAMLCAALAIVVLILLPHHTVMDALAAGDSTALALGIDPRRTRIGLIIVVSLAVALAVSATGGIGFIGLVVPHLARALMGARHRDLLPAAGLLGAAVLVLADLVARTAFSPLELPIGVLTGLLGAPLIIYIMRKQQRGGLNS